MGFLLYNVLDMTIGMEKSVSLCLGTYYVLDPLADRASLEKSYSNILKPLLHFLCNRQDIPFTLYLSGDAVSWLDQHYPEFFAVSCELAAKKKLDILGGGYFSPYFPFIPSAERVAQIEMLTTSLRKKLGRRPRGAWLPASAWEPAMISALSTCGIEYVLVDRFMLKYSGFPGVDGNSPVSVEENGKTATAIPSDASLNAFIEEYTEDAGAEMSVRKFCTALFDSLGEAEHGDIVFFIKPELIQKVFSGDAPWILRLLDFVKTENVQLSLETAAQIVKNTRKGQRWMFLPSGMAPMDIINPPAGCDYAALSKIPVKQNILNSLPGAFNLYSKMMYVHTLVNQIRGDKSRRNSAMEELCSAQNYLLFSQTDPARRAAARSYIYKKLLSAEKMTRQKGIFSDSIISFDYDFDRLNEYLSQTEKMNMYVHLAGGKIFEFDVFKAGKNFCDFPRECEYEKYLNCGGGLFIDYFINRESLPLVSSGPASLPQVFSSNFYQEAGEDINRLELNLKTSGFYGGFNQPVSLKKQYAFKKNGVQVQFILKNESPLNLSGIFMTELDFILSPAKKKAPSVSVFSGESRHSGEPGDFSFEKAEWILICDSDDLAKFKIEANENADIITCAEPYVPSSPESFYKVLKVFLHWQVDLSPGYETEKTVFLTLEV